jgi:lyso-ornithine lipid O-acyltransferase
MWTPFFNGLGPPKSSIQKNIAISDLRRVKTFRLFIRLLFFVVYTAMIVAEIWLRNRLSGVNMRRSMQVRQRWARNLLYGVGVRVETTGQAPDFPCLIVSNHRSYLDPILMLRDVYGYPVAKAELSKWPLIGKGAKMAGILYLRRESAGSRSGVLRQMQVKIESGFPVIIFPEGTTSDEAGTLPFKNGAFKLAAQANIQVVPVALVFEDPRDFWVTQESFLSHARRRFGSAKTAIKLHYGPPMRNEDPEILRMEAQQWIETVLLAKT